MTAVNGRKGKEMNTKAVVSENLKSTINEILENLSRIIDKKMKEEPNDPESLIKYVKSIEVGIAAAQRFDFVTGKCGAIINEETERELDRTVRNLTELIKKTFANDDINADDLLNFIKLLDLVALAWKRLYSFGENNPYA